MMQFMRHRGMESEAGSTLDGVKPAFSFFIPALNLEFESLNFLPPPFLHHQLQINFK
jgi:hypothetical protein